MGGFSSINWDRSLFSLSCGKPWCESCACRNDSWNHLNSSCEWILSTGLLSKFRIERKERMNNHKWRKVHRRLRSSTVRPVHQVIPQKGPIIVKIRVWSWLRRKASYMLNTCKSNVVFGELDRRKKGLLASRPGGEKSWEQSGERVRKAWESAEQFRTNPEES